jgi:hypothetical protein
MVKTGKIPMKAGEKQQAGAPGIFATPKAGKGPKRPQSCPINGYSGNIRPGSVTDEAK